MTAQPRLLALATSNPPYVLQQSVVRAEASRFFGTERETERLLPVFDNSNIDTRYSCVPLEWYAEPHGWTERNALYIENAVPLLEKAATEALDQAGLKPEDIDMIVVASTTGVATPSLDALLMERLPFRRDVQRLPIFGLGCAGGVLGISRAATMARAMPEARILYLVVELCALWFRRDDRSKSNIVATALFGDGAAAAVISCRGEGPAFGASGEHTWPDSLGIMGWDVEADGLKAIFSRDIPALVKNKLSEVADAFFKRNGLSLSDIGTLVCHPGGTKVIAALEEVFGLAAGTMVEARQILQRYGNMSAATVMFVLRKMLDQGIRERMLMTALGPGFSTGFLVLDNR
ncbi:MAG TPA: 3-oxoacyl-[acyl-carrier-protein] synthase III C-terminal domain-containing protein [Aliidongia sp.]|nr:3-oxoacyl-[acyl-carrier-protein] synthase III C-terminal domain-containing protein [Aliidongia sp.]